MEYHLFTLIKKKIKVTPQCTDKILFIMHARSLQGQNRHLADDTFYHEEGRHQGWVGAHYYLLYKFIYLHIKVIINY